MQSSKEIMVSAPMRSWISLRDDESVDNDQDQFSGEQRISAPSSLGALSGRHHCDGGAGIRPVGLETDVIQDCFAASVASRRNPSWRRRCRVQPRMGL